MKTNPAYYWPLRKKVTISGILIFKAVMLIFLIIALKLGAALGIKSWKGRYVPVLFCGLVPVFHDWDKMWKLNPPSHY